MNSDILEYANRIWNGEENFDKYRSGELQAHGILPIGDKIGFWPGLGNVIVFDCGDTLVMFDSGGRFTADEFHQALTAWCQKPVTRVVFSHGHLDHICGVGNFDRAADEAGIPRPVVLAHENLPHRFARYSKTLGYNEIINRRQFQIPNYSWPSEFRAPDVLVADDHTFRQGDLTFDLHHAKGETDDHLWLFVPELKVLCVGDLFIWCAPNAGNPQKVQRFPEDWAKALRRMAECNAELLLPCHGVPIQGVERVREVLLNTAEWLDSLVVQTVALMNEGRTLDHIIHTVRPPEHLKELPYLEVRYDDPEFVVRNIWRLYGGWYDGQASRLKPATDAALGSEVAALSGGARVLIERALALAASGDFRLACHLADFAADASPGDVEVESGRIEVYSKRAETEPASMARGIFSWAAAESMARLGGRGGIDKAALNVGGALHDGPLGGIYGRGV